MNVICLWWRWVLVWSSLPGPGCRGGWWLGSRGAGAGDCCHSSEESSPQAETGPVAEKSVTIKHWLSLTQSDVATLHLPAGGLAPSSSAECLKVVSPAEPLPRPRPPPRSRGGTWTRSAVSQGWRVSAWCPGGTAGAPRGARESPLARPASPDLHLGRLEAGQADGKRWAGRRSSRWAHWAGSGCTGLGTVPSTRF